MCGHVRLFAIGKDRKSRISGVRLKHVWYFHERGENIYTVAILIPPSSHRPYTGWTLLSKEPRMRFTQLYTHDGSLIPQKCLSCNFSTCIRRLNDCAGHLKWWIIWTVFFDHENIIYFIGSNAFYWYSSVALSSTRLHPKHLPVVWCPSV